MTRWSWRNRPKSEPRGGLAGLAVAAGATLANVRSGHESHRRFRGARRTAQTGARKPRIADARTHRASLIWMGLTDRSQQESRLPVSDRRQPPSTHKRPTIARIRRRRAVVGLEFEFDVPFRWVR